MSASTDCKQRFRTEREFVEELRVAILTSLPEQSFPIRHTTELAVGNNIADLALLLTESPGLDAPIQVFTTRECVVLATLRRGGATRIDILERQCGVERTEFRSGGLRRLVEWGLVEFGKGGRISLSPERWPFHVVAVEAKLRKWNDALEQAARYTQYADESFVALPEEFSGPAIENQLRFVQAGIGLMVLNEKGLHIAIESAPHERHNWRREFVISRLSVAGDDWAGGRSCRSNSSMHCRAASPRR